MSDAIRLEAIQKRYPGAVVAANKGVSLAVAAGSIHALVGENGAGKSTLLHVAYGSVRADSGRLWIKGEEVPLGTHSPSGSIARGVGMVHQHFMLVPNLSVAENVMLGRERGLVTVAGEIAAIGKRLGVNIDPRVKVEDLSVGEQQRVEIVKILWRGADVLLLDEPTAVLTAPEVRELMRVLEGLAGEGKTIVLVTHKLDEVEAVAHATTVMRAGEVVATFDKGAKKEEIGKAIVGKGTSTSTTTTVTRTATTGGKVLVVKDLRVGRALGGVSFEVGGGEIVGIAGVLGNGQSELVLAIAGLVAQSGGTVAIEGKDLGRATPRERLEAGLAHVPEDRHLRGLVLDLTLAENLILGRQKRWLDRKEMDGFARERLGDLDVRPPEPEAIARRLSGGNQQKVVVARELARPNLSLLVAAEPTRGVDIGASEAIRARIRAAAAGGAGVLLVSSDLTELRALADRLLVFYRGRIVAERTAAASDEELGALMTGAA